MCADLVLLPELAERARVLYGQVSLDLVVAVCRVAAGAHCGSNEVRRCCQRFPRPVDKLFLYCDPPDAVTPALILGEGADVEFRGSVLPALELGIGCPLAAVFLGQPVVFGAKAAP